MPNWVEITKDNLPQILGWVAKAPPGVCVAFKRPRKRTKDQNDMMWPYLRKIANAVDWDGHKLTDYQWKDVFTGSLWGGLSVPGIEGGVVFVGARHTSDLNREEMSELLDCIIAFAAQRGIELED